MAANQNKAPTIVMGFPSCTFALDNSLALNATTIWLGMQLVPSATKTLSKVKLFLDTKSGTPAASECTCDLYSDANGIPNASTEGPISADSVPASGNWMQWTFAGTSALSGGTPYWMVFKNTNAVAAVNFPTYRFHNSGLVLGTPIQFQSLGVGGTGVWYGWNKLHTINSGVAWASGQFGGVAGMRLEYTDGTFEGMPMQSQLRPSNGSTSDMAFGTQEAGVRFNLPVGATFNVMRVGFPVLRVSTPGNLRFRLYQGVTLLATTADVPSTNVVTGTGDWYFASFSSAQPIVSTNQPFRVVFGDATAADTNTKGYNTQLYTWENDANSLALKPMNGTLQKTVTTDNTASPVVFTDTATDIFPFAMLLDTNGELTPAASSGGVSGIIGDGSTW